MSRYSALSRIQESTASPMNRPPDQALMMPSLILTDAYGGSSMTTESLAGQFTDGGRREKRVVDRHRLVLLRIAISIVFLWFGALKLVPGMSPAEPLIRATITFLPMNLFLPFLAVLEMTIGLGFITGKFKR